MFRALSMPAPVIRRFPPQSPSFFVLFGLTMPQPLRARHGIEGPPPLPPYSLSCDRAVRHRRSQNTFLTALQPTTMWDPVAYSLHWQSIPLADLSVDASEVEAAADVSLVSGKVRRLPPCPVSAAVICLLNRRAHSSPCSCVPSRLARLALRTLRLRLRELWCDALACGVVRPCFYMLGAGETTRQRVERPRKQQRRRCGRQWRVCCSCRRPVWVCVVV